MQRAGASHALRIVMGSVRLALACAVGTGLPRTHGPGPLAVSGRFPRPRLPSVRLGALTRARARGHAPMRSSAARPGPPCQYARRRPVPLPWWAGPARIAQPPAAGRAGRAVRWKRHCQHSPRLACMFDRPRRPWPRLRRIRMLRRPHATGRRRASGLPPPASRLKFGPA